MGMQRGWGVAYGKPGVQAGKDMKGKAAGKE